MGGSIPFPSNKLIRLMVTFAWYLQSLHHEHLTDFYRLFFPLFDGLFQALLEGNEAVGQWLGLALHCSQILHHQSSFLQAAAVLCHQQLDCLHVCLQTVPVEGSISIAPAESRRRSKCQPEAERTNHPCFCQGQCNGNRGSLAQAQHHRSNTRN